MDMRRVAATAVGLVMVAGAGAQTYMYDFEPPAYAPGPLHGQDSWTTNTAVGFPLEVSNAAARGGVQSARVNNFGSATRYLRPDQTAVDFSGPWTVAFSMFLESGNPGGLTFAVAPGGFGASWYLSMGTGGRVDINNGQENRVLALNPAQLVDQWIDFTVSGSDNAPFPNGAMTVRIRGASIDHTEVLASSPAADIAFVRFRSGFETLSNTGSGWVDNISIPGPAGLALLVIAGVGSRRRR